jgi:hypothetical protein
MPGTRLTRGSLSELVSSIFPETAGSAAIGLVQRAHYGLTKVRADHIKLNRPQILSPCAAKYQRRRP